MMSGVASQGYSTSEIRVGDSLKRVNPQYHHQRRDRTYRQIYPALYKADYLGHKCHIDQNEKLAMFGVTHICAIDGYSGKIVAFTTMPIKNNVTIYDHIYRYIKVCFMLFI